MSEPKIEIRNWIRENIINLKIEDLCSEGAKKFNTTSGAVRAILKRMKSAGQLNPTTKLETIKSKISSKVSVETIIYEFDIVSRVEREILALKDEVVYDEDLRRELKVGYDRWKSITKSIKFDHLKLILPNKKIVWGNEKTLEKIRKVTELV